MREAETANIDDVCEDAELSHVWKCSQSISRGRGFNGGKVISQDLRATFLDPAWTMIFPSLFLGCIDRSGAFTSMTDASVAVTFFTLWSFHIWLRAQRADWQRWLLKLQSALKKVLLETVTWLFYSPFIPVNHNHVVPTATYSDLHSCPFGAFSFRTSAQPGVDALCCGSKAQVCFFKLYQSAVTPCAVQVYNTSQSVEYCCAQHVQRAETTIILRNGGWVMLSSEHYPESDGLPAAAPKKGPKYNSSICDVKSEGSKNKLQLQATTGCRFV